LWKFPGGAGKNPSVFEAQSDIYTEKLWGIRPGTR
jgi:hypothetical protein